MLLNTCIRSRVLPTKYPRYLFFLLLLFGVISVIAGRVPKVAGRIPKVAQKFPAEQLLRHALFKKKYERHTRVVPDTSDEFVMVQFSLKRIVSMDMASEVLTIYGWLTLTWTDGLLRWNPEDFGNITQISMPLQQIWVPDFEVHNSANEYTSLHDGVTQAVVRHWGDVTWIEPKTISSICPVDATYFPFDEQTCHLKIMSWTRQGVFELNMLSESEEEIEVDDSANLGGWTITRTAINRSIDFDLLPYAEPPVELHITLVMQRKSLHYVCILILPWILFSLVAIATYSLPLDNFIRIGLQIFIQLLICSSMPWDIVEELPESPKSTPLILLYMFAMITLAWASVISTLVLLMISNIGKHSASRALPSWLRWVLPQKTTLNPVNNTFNHLPDIGQPIIWSGHLDSWNNYPCGSKVMGRYGCRCACLQDRFQSKVWSDEWTVFAIRLDTICFIIYAVLLVFVNISLLFLVV